MEALGAFPARAGVVIRAWAPHAREVSVQIGARAFALEARGDGAFEARLEGAGPGARYMLAVDGRALPDPYARFLPDGVHGAAEIIDPSYPWLHPQRPIALQDGPVLYELHVGAFTREGTYAAAEARLDHLVELGVSAIELMPLAAFPGQRGWGYDGVALFAPFAGYGRPEALKHFIDAAHGRGLSVILDVVLNHFGPDGNYLSAWAPEYFDANTQTPWGDAPAFDHPRMRRLALDVIASWLGEYRFDGIRLDATHAIADRSILAEIAALARTFPEPRVIIAEDDRRDRTLVTELGLDAVWADDLHHVMHVLMTGEQDGYYASFSGAIAELAGVIERGWRGESVERDRLVSCLQNHDQVGNRALGERLSMIADPDLLAGATLVWLALPMTPLVFMGQEWGASTPFLYFTDHEPALGEKIIAGRRQEFAAFPAFADATTRAEIPSPQAQQTLARSTLAWEELARAPHAAMLALFKRAIALRRTDPVLSRPRASEVTARVDGDVLVVTLRALDQNRQILWNTGAAPVRCPGEILLASAQISDATLPPRASAIVAERA